MASNRSKYGKNKNLWRRVYGHKRRKPEITSFVDASTNVTVSYDLHRIYRDRDYFIIKSAIPASLVTTPTPIILAEYDEGLVAFNNTTSGTRNFNFIFSNAPDAVVLTEVTAAPSSPNSDFVIPFGVSFNATSLVIETSAPFTGSVRYRAVYSSLGYPALATSSLEPTSGTFRVSAGEVPSINATSYIANFSALAASPSLFYKTPWDTSANFGADVYLTQDTTTATSVTGSISAPLNNKIYFIAVE